MPKAKKPASQRKPIDFETFVRGALATGKPPATKPKKRKAKK